MSNKINEIWKDIPNYEGIYQVSNLGNVKSLNRKCVREKSGKVKNLKERILKNYKNKYGYFVVTLTKESNVKCFKVHQLVAMAFLNHTPCGVKIVVDHINNDKLDNRLENLQLITSRENSSKDKKGGTSKYIGVFWFKKLKKWRSSIYVNGKNIYLGYFIDELEAAKAYQDKLKTIKQKL